MPQKVSVAFQNNFTAGLKTEFSGLNFPPNAATDADNVVFSIIGDVLRREGIDFEANYQTNTVDRTNCAIASHRWLNVGGDGQTQILVVQIGNTLYFYKTSAATTTSPMSAQLLTNINPIQLTSFLASGSTLDPSGVECQFADGNGYLFVYHPYCDPFYCTFSAAPNPFPPAVYNYPVQAYAIRIQTRDFNGIPEAGVPTTFRPNTLTAEHNYNLQNQGWTQATLWSTQTTTVNEIATMPGQNVFTVPAGLTININDPVTMAGSYLNSTAVGNVVSYSGTSLIINITYATSDRNEAGFEGWAAFQIWTISEANTKDLIDTWHVAIGNYPSNADVWWLYKDDTSVFNPATTQANVIPTTSPAPEGHFILDTFNQQRTATSSITGITPVSTSARPRTGTWFLGRVWYTGVDASQVPTGDMPYATWTENIYFSQIITDATQFGMCYQVNDPTDENLFNLLPSDGGVVTIQGSGAIYKLFPIQNGMLVFAANGIWFITGSQGIGFTANDYTITKLSAVESIASTSYVDVNGLPVFWNEEGIYTVSPAQQGLGLIVNAITLGTILSLYAAIPASSKRYVKGAHNPLDYIVQWAYRSTPETSVTDRYQFDRILVLNTSTQAFYTYSITGTPYIHDVVYIAGPGGTGSPDPVLKYITSYAHSGSYNFTFSEERNTDFVDWEAFDNVGIDYTSYFVTGYAIPTQGLRMYQPDYVFMYSRGGAPNAYTIQGIWDFSTSGNSGKQSSIQLVTLNKPYHGVVYRKHRIRGHGIALQLKISSVSNAPFDFIGWSVWNVENMGI